MAAERAHNAAPRRAEVVAALSLALDLGLGQPMEHMLRSAVIASRLADQLGLGADQRGVVYYADLMAWVGCHAESHEVSKLLGDDIAYRQATYQVDTTGLPLLRVLLQHVGSDRSWPERARSKAMFLGSARRQLTEMISSHYAAACALSDWLDMGEEVRTAVGYTFERWDGAGLPRGAHGEEIPLEMRIVHLSDVAEVHLREGGRDAALAVARDRSGTQFDPEVVAAFTLGGAQLLDPLVEEDSWRAALREAPGRDRVLTPEQLDRLLLGLGAFADLRSPMRHGHSRRVGELAAAAARLSSLTEEEVRRLRQAGYVHDIGRMGVSSTIINKATVLSTSERERVRLYPYLTQRILERVEGLRAVATLAGQHRERLDGSGFPHGVDGSWLSLPARLLAVADRYESLREPRPYRDALSPTLVKGRLGAEARSGRLDRDAVEAVLAAAGHGSPPRPRNPGGLTARELQILRLVATGRSSHAIAKQLVISEKTVRNHVEHIYLKAGVSNRVGASLFALKHDLIDPARGGTS